MPEPLVLWLPAAENPEQMEQARWLELAAAELECTADDLDLVVVDRISFDARRRSMQWRVAAEAYRKGEELPSLELPQKPVITPPADDAPHVVIVGSGPAGLFAAMELLQAGIRVTVCERGKQVQERRRDIAKLNRGEDADVDSNYAFGEGGAGTYSDGKLYTRSSKRQNVREVLETLVAHGSPPIILNAWRPHIGSNLLPKVVEDIRETIEQGGGKMLFQTRVASLETEALPGAEEEGAAQARVTAAVLADGTRLEADAVILATGHSALDALLFAREAGASMEPKGFAMGVRVEHPQAWLDDLQYHGRRQADDLPAAFYEMSVQVRERGVFSFCMCPGGWIVPSQSVDGTLVVNGMSLASRDSPFANSGYVVAIEPKDWCGKRGWRWGWPDLLRKAAKISDHPMLHEVVEDPRGGAPLNIAEGRLPVHPLMDPLFGVRLQLALEIVAAHAGGGEHVAPAQRCDLFFSGDATETEPLGTSYLPGLKPVDFDTILPKGMASRMREGMETFEKKMPGFVSEFGQMIGVETRTSSPVRLLRDKESLQNPQLTGLYPCGEGAGFAGGIVSAALDGLRVGRAFLASRQESSAPKG